MTTENMYKVVVIVGLTMRLPLQPVIRRKKRCALLYHLWKGRLEDITEENGKLEEEKCKSKREDFFWEKSIQK